jgi:hypothetical protein
MSKARSKERESNPATADDILPEYDFSHAPPCVGGDYPEAPASTRGQPPRLTAAESSRTRHVRCEAVKTDSEDVRSDSLSAPAQN